MAMASPSRNAVAWSKCQPQTWSCPRAASLAESSRLWCQESGIQVGAFRSPYETETGLRTTACCVRHTACFEGRGTKYLFEVQGNNEGRLQLFAST